MTKKQIALLTHPYTNLTRITATTDPQVMRQTLSKGAGAELTVKYISPFLSNWHEVEKKVLKVFQDKVKLSKWINTHHSDISSYIETLKPIFNYAEYKIGLKPKQVPTFDVFEGRTQENLNQTASKHIFYNKQNTRYYLIADFEPLSEDGIVKTFVCINFLTAKRLEKELAGYLL